jgi:hypothetical protein
VTELEKRQGMQTTAKKKYSNENLKATIPSTYYNVLNTVRERGTFRLSGLPGK